MEKVSAVTCQSYDLEDVYSAMKAALEGIDFSMPEYKTVLIKPNIMSQNKPHQHSITHYALVDALCRILSERNCRIQIGESIAFYQKGLTRKAYETSGIKAVAEKYDATLLFFEEEPLVEMHGSRNESKELYIPKILLEADAVINLCKLKTHSAMRFSGALKNMFGCLPGGYKQRFHQWAHNEFELSDVFLDIHDIVKPSLSIMDAIVSLDGGPSAIGKPMKTSTLIASTNAAALDVIACKLIGYEPTDISTLIRAKERQMISSFDDIRLIGEITPVQFNHLKKGPVELEKKSDSIFVNHTYVMPKIEAAKCTKCGQCATACPVNAIESSGNPAPTVDHGTCINCYYCLSVCPVGAITIHSTFMNKFMRGVRAVTRI